MKYAFDHPQVLDQIPSGVEIIVIPLDDPELIKENKKMAEDHKKAGRQVVLVKFRRPEPVAPELELLKK